MLEGTQNDKIPSQIIFQMPKLGLMNLICTAMSSVEEGIEMEEKQSQRNGSF